MPCLLLRIGFVGELGYEIHFPAAHGEHLWDALLEAGAPYGIRPFGLEPQRILRLQKQHIIVGQDTDSESTPYGAAMPWAVKLDKERGLHRQVGARRTPPSTRRDDAGRLHARQRARADRGRGRARRARHRRRPGHERAPLAPARSRDRDGLGAGRARAATARRITIADAGSRLQGSDRDRAVLRPRRGAAALVSGSDFLVPSVEPESARRPHADGAAGPQGRRARSSAATAGTSRSATRRARARTTRVARDRRLRRPLAPGQARASGRARRPRRVVRAASGGVTLEPGIAVRDEDAWWCPVTPARVLVLGEPSAAPACASGLARDRRRRGRADRDRRRRHLRTGRARADRARARASCSPASARSTCATRSPRWPASVPGSVARTPGYLLREAEDRLLVLFGWALGEYLWEVVADAAEHLGGGPRR